MTTAAMSQGFDVTIRSPWELDPVKRVLDLEQLPPNWDGYGTNAIDRNTTTRAIALIRSIAHLGFDSLPLPEVTPVSEGGVHFVWANGPRRLGFFVLPEGVTEYLKQDSADLEEGEIDPRTSRALRDLVSWILGGARLA